MPDTPDERDELAAWLRECAERQHAKAEHQRKETRPQDNSRQETR